MRRNHHENEKSLVPIIYILFLMLPIYWLLAMSFQNHERDPRRVSASSHRNWTLENYIAIFTDPTWYWGYINSIIYVTLNTVISVSVALPAAYAFSRYSFVGDKHLFFWLLTNRMAPGRRLRTTFLPALFRRWFVRHATWLLHLRTACSMCRWRSGSWKGS